MKNTTDTAADNRNYSAEYGFECAECGHVWPDMVEECDCCAAVDVTTWILVPA